MNNVDAFLKEKKSRHARILDCIKLTEAVFT